ncbi:bifunctional 3-(3-hydroxy-phenyl)propionate/3-hydroxycinnamic acid hydroxylase [Massilia sp. BJB1822]|uniref:bifunctional 3-(3-hydroxy-phenyl)propionate/3-hydroxycinnamic acid hydroxylase MhpA n=1 Tax=Massilia sp. BJB1822 TaxID=2744470 RepID=UPI001594B45C|nr:bifunctional 3-(3-hydroxy-phenyl)propionate/3-hydroxycinnamic acid hydroxylase [Massilia sp. BJB1822]NVE01261.1 bifunctional 3-(3-hydroxy-phenyl)propionate/3-hydroxycinnamic acid hydroxylase [Massilia sp. BJB1822]
MGSAENIDVLVVGLGPTGLMLAHLLGKRGARVVVLEREPQFYGNARAVYTDDECMRIFQAAGVAGELEQDMVLDCPAQWVLRDGSVLAQFVRTDRPNGWSLSNFIYQPALENKLEALLSRYPNVTVLRGRELLSHRQDASGVTASHGACAGTGYGVEPGKQKDAPRDLQTIRAKFMVGCDGGRSAVRTQLRIQLSGKSFPNPWLVVDVRARSGEDCFRHLPYFNFVCDPACPTVSCPQPDNHHRFEFMLAPDQSRESMEEMATVERLLSHHVDVGKIEVLRRLVYTFNALVAERWREGRVFLAGDAAHMTPQFMGQGMSSGIRDAYNLAWKLDAVLRQQADMALLDTYERERKPHAKEMIDVSIRMKDFVSESRPLAAALRNLTVRVLLHTPVLRNYLREGRFKPPPTYVDGSYLGLLRRSRKAPEGRPVLQPTVRSYDGKRLLLDEVLGEGFAVLGFNTDPAGAMTLQQRTGFLDGGVRFVTVYPLGHRPQGYRNVAHHAPPGVCEIEDINGDLVAWLKAVGVRKGGTLLIRPDKFVYAHVPAARVAATLNALFIQIGRPSRSAGDHHEQYGRQRASR